MLAISHHPDARATRSDERGQGSISALASVVVFLGFLFFAVHLVISLYATSTVTGQAYDAARKVASADTDGDRGAAMRRAEADLRGSLGDYSDNIESLDWSGSTDDVIRLRVRAQNPSFLVFATAPLGVEEIDRTVTVRVEKVR